MANPQLRRKHWRPRFSVRTLLLLVTFVCAFLGGWLPTARDGKQDVIEYVKFTSGAVHSSHEGEVLARSMRIGARTIENVSAIFPFVLLVDEWHPTEDDPYRVHRGYYFWAFGYVAELPV